MVITKVKNIVVGICADGVGVKLLLKISDGYGRNKTVKTLNRQYYNGTPIHYPEIFSGIFK